MRLDLQLLCTLVLWTSVLATAVETEALAAPCRDSARAVVLFNEGRRDAAYPLLSQLSEQGCDESIVYLYKGAYERDHDHLDRAAETFRRGLVHDPTNVQLLLELAVVYSWSGRLSDALAVYQAVRRLDSSSTPARLGEARVSGWMGRRNEATAGFEVVLAEQPDNVEALSGLAAVHLAAFRVDSARTYYRRVLAIDPANAVAREGLQRADAVKRLEISAGMVSAVPSGSPVRGLGLSVSYHLTPEVRMMGGYNTSTHDPILEQYDARLRGEAVAVASDMNVGVGWRMSPSSSVTAAYETRVTEGDRLHSVSVDTSRVLSGASALLGSMRSSVSTLDGSRLLGSAGLSFAPTAATTVVVRGFYGASRTSHSKAIAGTIHFAAWRGLTTSATMAVSRERSAAVTLSGAAAFPVAADARLRVEGTVYRGQYRSQRVAVTLTAGF